MRRDIGWGGTTGAVLLGLGLAAAAGAQDVSELPGQDRALSPALEEVYRVGAFDGEAWETFGDVRGVGFDEAGNLYVFDAQAGTVVKVDPSGRHVANIGTPGEGPGELRQPVGFTVMRDGRVVVADMGHRAYTIFRPDGTFERSVSMGGGGMIRIGEFRPDPSGRGVIMGGGGSMSISMEGGPGRGAPEMPTGRPIERLDLSGSEVAATTVVSAWAPERQDRPERLEGGGMSFSVSVGGPATFEPGLYVGTLPDGGLAWADTATYTIKMAGPDGSLRRVVRRPMAPRPVTEAMQEAEKARRLAELEEGGGPQMRMVVAGGGGGTRAVPQDAMREMMRGRIEQMQFYPVLPVIQDMTSGWNGKLWVERRGPEPVGPGPIDVITPAGQYVGSFAADAMRIPDAFGPDGLAAFIERDDLDVPTVVVRRLPAILR